MSPEHIDADSVATKRARSYLRWYPLAWRERYGEEFVAHLESELTDRPDSLVRTLDIVAHGLLARMSLQRGLRTALHTAMAVVVVATAVVGVVVARRYWAPITITSGHDGGQSGVGLFSSPTQVDDVSFNFTTQARVAIRIASVTIVPLRGFAVPQIVGVDFAAQASELVNGRGWPIQLAKSANVLEGNVPLVPAIGTTVTLATTNALWLGLRAPSLRHAYAVEGLRVTYERHGRSHTMTINQSAAPDVICASSSHSAQIPNWCAQEIRAANTIAMFSKDSPTSATWPSVQGQMIAQLALNAVTSSGGRTPTLRDVRHWANRLFPVNGANAVREITGVVRAGMPEWRFVIRKGSSASTLVRCTSRGHVTSGGGVIGVTAARCPT